jgi:hypothetical protein
MVRVTPLNRPSSLAARSPAKSSARPRTPRSPRSLLVLAPQGAPPRAPSTAPACAERCHQDEDAAAVDLLIGMPSRRRPAAGVRGRAVWAPAHTPKTPELNGLALPRGARGPSPLRALQHFRLRILSRLRPCYTARQSAPPSRILGRLPLVIPWSLLASRATPLAITTSRTPPPSPSPLVQPVLRRDRRSSSPRSRLRGFMCYT